jgi:hypothetical protein
MQVILLHQIKWGCNSTCCIKQNGDAIVLLASNKLMMQYSLLQRTKSDAIYVLHQHDLDAIC